MQNAKNGQNDWKPTIRSQSYKLKNPPAPPFVAYLIASVCTFNIVTGIYFFYEEDTEKTCVKLHWRI